jgi:hypothetical protein
VRSEKKKKEEEVFVAGYSMEPHCSYSAVLIPVLSASKAYMSLWEQECVTLVTISVKSGSRTFINLL